MTKSIAEVIKAFDSKTTPMAKDITKRELFAAMAMSGWLASFGPDAKAEVFGVAKFAVSQADALLAELAKEKKE